MYIKHSPKKISIKGYKKDDCTINSIGTALGVSYDLSRKILQTGYYYEGQFSFAKNEYLPKKYFMQRPHVKRICEALSVNKTIYMSDEEVMNKEEFRRKNSKNKREYLVRDFAKENKEGIFIVLATKHLVTIIDGKILDTWDSGEKEVEVVYEVNLEKARETIKALAKYYKMDSSKHIFEHNETIKLSSWNYI